MNFCLGELILKLLTRIGECHQNRSENTGRNSLCVLWFNHLTSGDGTIMILYGSPNCSLFAELGPDNVHLSFVYADFRFHFQFFLEISEVSNIGSFSCVNNFQAIANQINSKTNLALWKVHWITNDVTDNYLSFILSFKECETLCISKKLYSHFAHQL